MLASYLFIYVGLSVIAAQTYFLKEKIVSEVQSAVDAVVAQLGKAKGEIVAAIEELQAREPSVDLSALVSAAQSLDDVVPDAPVEEAPVEEVPVEEAPVSE